MRLLSLKFLTSIYPTMLRLRKKATLNFVKTPDDVLQTLLKYNQAYVVWLWSLVRLEGLYLLLPFVDVPIFLAMSHPLLS